MTVTTGITVAHARYTLYRDYAPDALYVAFGGENAAKPMATRAGSGAAKVIGRVGSLAVALGIGTAVASTPWVAVAEPSASGGSGSSSSSSSESSDSSGLPSVSEVTSSGAADSSVTGPASSSGSTPRVVMRSSGGANTSGVTEGDTGDTAAGEEAPSAGEESVTDDELSTAPDENGPANGSAEAALESGDPATEPESTTDPVSVKVAEQVSDSDHAAGLPPAASPASTTLSARLVTNSIAVVRDSDVVRGAAPAAVSAGPPSVAVVQDVSADTDAPAIPVSPVSAEPDTVSEVLAWVGLGGPSTNGTGPAAPAPSPGLVLASAFVRRQLQQTVEAQALAVSQAVMQTTSQTELGLFDRVLHLFFNNTPTTNYNPAENSQDAAGVVTGDLNAADVDGDKLVYSVTQAPQHGTVVVNSDGSFTYTPDLGVALIGGTDTFEVTVSDDTYFHLLHLGGGHTTTAAVDVTVARIDPAVTTIDLGDPDILAQGVAVSPDGTRAYVTTGGEVAVIDTATNTITTTIDVGAGQFASSDAVAVSPDGTRVYVTTHNESTVSVIDSATNTVTSTIDVGFGPDRLAVSPDGTRVYVTYSTGGTVTVIDTATNAVIATIDAGSSGSDVAVSPDGTRVYVTDRSEDGAVAIIDTATNTVTAAIDLGVGIGPWSVAVSRDGTRVYATSTVIVGDFPDHTLQGVVSVIDTATNTVTATISTDDALLSGVAVSPDGTAVYVAAARVAGDGGRQFIGTTVLVIDAATNTVTSAIDVGAGPDAVAVSPDGTRVYVTNLNDGTVSVIGLPMAQTSSQTDPGLLV